MALTLEQKQLRRTGITATDAAALVFSPFRTIYDIYLDKIGEIEAEEEGKDRNRLAQTIERELIDMMGEKYGLDVKPGCTVVHPTEKWIIATPDNFLVEDTAEGFNTVGVGEVKNVGTWMQLRDWQAGPPAYTKVQNLWAQIAAIVKRGVIGAAMGGTQPEFYENNYEAKAAEAMQELGYNLWHKHVLPRNPPKPDGSESAARMVRALYPVDCGEVRDATDEECLMIARYARLGGLISKLEDKREALGNQLRLAIGECSGLEIDGYTCSYKLTDGGRVAWKKVAEAAKADQKTIEKFSKPSRRLLVSKKGAA